MSTFLQLCKDVRRECGIAGSGPTSVVAQIGELERVVGWVANSYVELQRWRPNWRWLRSEFSLQTVASTGEYGFDHANMTDSIASAAITRFARWWPMPEGFKLYLASAGLGTRHAIPYWRWEEFKELYLTGNPTASYPSCVSIDPRNKLRLGPVPDAIYTLTGEYQKSAQILAADADEPEMPEDFHQLIVAKAMKKYAAWHSAPEVYAQAKDIEAALLGPLVADQLPVMRYGPSLA